MSASSTDEVSIQVGGTRFQGWQSVQITRSCETMPNSWAVAASTEFFQGPALTQTRPGQACNIYVGNDLVITGWIDRRTIDVDARQHPVVLSGRGITRNLVDCSADLIKDPGLLGGVINATSTLDLAQRLCKSFKITARSVPTNLGLAIPGFRVNLGETPYQIIESAARYAGFLVYEDQNGNLVLDQVGKTSHASGFAVPGNVEKIRAERSVDQRYSDYLVVWTAVNQLADLGALSNHRAETNDPTMTEYRPRIIVSEQITPAYDVGLARAKWELARRLGRSQAAMVTCDSWRDVAGKLWTPNMLAAIDAPSADISGATWIIGTVTLRKDASGTHADLVLMPPDAFNPEPNPLNLFDNELARSPQTSQNPAPPSTDPPASSATGQGVNAAPGAPPT